MSYDKCSATLTVTFRYLDKNGTEDDFIEKAYIDLEFTNGRVIYLDYLGSGSCSGADICITDDGTNRRFDYSGIYNSISVERNGKSDKKYYITVTLKDIPENLLNDDLKVRFFGKWKVNGEDGTEYDFDYTEYLPTYNITAPTSLLASNKEYCDKVRLTWTNPSFGCTENWKTKIYRGLQSDGSDDSYITKVE